jgi:hypothetical protein
MTISNGMASAALMWKQPAASVVVELEYKVTVAAEMGSPDAEDTRAAIRVPR